MTELITMTPKELSRYEIINRLINKEINGAVAAKQLGLSLRQTKRLKVKVKQQGAKGLIHRNRGQPSNHRLRESKIKQMETLIKKHYSDFGPTFAAEKLKKIHHLKVSKEKLRQLMIGWNLWQSKPRKGNKEYRIWRPRKEQYGEMVQFDGSYEHWFEERAPECCLLAAIDDATGKLTKLEFAEHEGVKPIFSFWQSYVKKQGKPLSIYLDRLRTYKQNLKSVVDDPEARTQFQRAMELNLGIKIIHAFSPQAKGRVERLFGTLQDRLVKELRLRNISDMKTANEFLKKEYLDDFNTCFAVRPAKKGNLHQSLTGWEKEHLEQTFSIHKTRVVTNDFTIRYENRWFQLAEKQPCLVRRKEKVTTEERIDGQIFISLKNKNLIFTELPSRPQKVKMKVIALGGSSQTWKPPADHPWRKAFLIEKAKAERLVSTK